VPHESLRTSVVAMTKSSLGSLISAVYCLFKRLKEPLRRLVRRLARLQRAIIPKHEEVTLSSRYRLRQQRRERIKKTYWVTMNNRNNLTSHTIIITNTVGSTSKAPISLLLVFKVSMIVVLSVVCLLPPTHLNRRWGRDNI